MQKITHKNQLPPIILGSSSPFRKALLEKLQLPFAQHAPQVDETPLEKESPLDMVQRLSRLKAQAIAKQSPEHIIIASDQCATFNNQPVGKPHTHENAVKQLQEFSGQSITFYTGLVVFDPRTQSYHQRHDETIVHFRPLNETTIQNYLLAETPYQCAGSFKSEGLGITLFSSIQSRDPNALIGLPLIELTNIFQEMGITLPLAE